jgi:hypothetical protein
MKKLLMTCLLAIMLAMSFGYSAFANVDDYKGDMAANVNEKLKEEFTYFKNGSLSLDSLELFEVNGEEIEQVMVGVASFKTVKDNFFAFTHGEFVYYDPINQKLLSATDVSSFEEIAAYKEAHKDQTGKHMHLTVIMLLHAFLFIVPMYFMFVWEKQQYSTTSYTTPNNVYNNQKTFN